MISIDLSDRLAQMFKESREASGFSQEYVAKALGISRKTVQNWEAGFGSPNFRSCLEWFDAIGQPMYPYLMNLLYPAAMENVIEGSDMDKIREALHLYIDELDDVHVKELLYLLYGEHGSSPTGTLDLITTYLHLPLAMRVICAENLLNTYETAQVIGFVNEKDNVIPQNQTLIKYINSAKEAVKNGKETYTVTEKET